MAHASILPDEVLKVIARQVGERFSSGDRGASPTGPQLSVAESFPVWMLGLDATTRADQDFKSLAVNTGDWHHQLHNASGKHSMCRSTANGPNPEDWQLISLSPASDLAVKIDATIEWIDSNVSGDPLVRIIKIPAYLLLAFWLTTSSSDEIVIIDMPKRITKLAYHKVYPAKQFLELLSQERHVQGVPQP